MSHWGNTTHVKPGARASGARCCSPTHRHAPPLQLPVHRADVDGEAQRQLATSLLGVTGREDAHVRPVWPGSILAVVVADQVFQVSRQQQGLPAQLLHAGHVEHLQEDEETGRTGCRKGRFLALFLRRALQYL